MPKKKSKKKKKKSSSSTAAAAAAAPALPEAADGLVSSDTGDASLISSIGAIELDSSSGGAASGGAASASAATVASSASSSSSGGSGGAAAQKALAEALGIGFGRGRVSRHAAKKQAAADRPHAFWDTQPVPSITDEVVTHGPVEEKTLADVREEGLPLPSAFEWCSVDIADAVQLQEVYKLLTENYVEDDDNMFRFDYSKEFLMWALTVPNYHSEWHVGVRQKSNGRLRAFITGIPAHVQVYKAEPLLMAEINFLCVHKKLRSHRLAPVLIKEITRRVNLKGGWQAVYTAGVVLPKPIASCRYWHRSINPIKLIECGFSRLGRRMTPSRTRRLYDLPKTTSIPGISPLLAADVPSACALLNTYLDQFDIHIVYTEEEFAHYFIMRPMVVESFVVRDTTSGDVTDFCSWYHLPSSVMNNPKHSKMFAAYSYYNVATTVPLEVLMKDCLILAKQSEVDVFNALDIMHNSQFLEKLKFGIGDGHLQYYLYNWRAPEMQSKQVGLVLL